MGIAEDLETAKRLIEQDRGGPPLPRPSWELPSPIGYEIAFDAVGICDLCDGWFPVYTHAADETMRCPKLGCEGEVLIVGNRIKQPTQEERDAYYAERRRLEDEVFDRLNPYAYDCSGQLAKLIDIDALTAQQRAFGEKLAAAFQPYTKAMADIIRDATS